MMRGRIAVDAPNEKAAMKLAVEKSGDVLWKYEGTCEGRRGPRAEDCREVK